jgi:hypothetical protein
MGRRAPQAPSAGTRYGVPADSRSAWWPRISGSSRALSACPALLSIRRPVSGVSVQCPRVRCPRDRCPVSGVGVQASGCPLSDVGVRRPVSGVRCPVGRPGIWASGVRYPGVPASAVSEPGEFVKRADAASSHTARTAGVGVVARTISTTGCGLPESEPDARSWRRPCWPTEASAWPWSKGGLGQRPGSTA